MVTLECCTAGGRNDDIKYIYVKSSPTPDTQLLSAAWWAKFGQFICPTVYKCEGGQTEKKVEKTNKK